MKPLKAWEIDINKNYYIDEDYNVWDSEEDFIEYHSEEFIGASDMYDEWVEQLLTENKLIWVTGSEAIGMLFASIGEKYE